MPSDSPTVGEILREQARSRGDHPLLICDADRISYAEAERRSAQLARGLIALGAGKGSHVGLLYPNGVAFVVGMLAAARIGAVVVPFSTFATARELREQLRRQRHRRFCSPPRPTDPTTTCNGWPRCCRLRARLRRSAIRRRRTAIASRHRSTSPAPRINSADTVDEALLDRDGRRRRRLGSTGDRLHVGHHQHPQGRGAHPRRAAQPPAKSQRDPGPDRRRQAVLQFAVLLDRRIRIRVCWPRWSPGRRWSAPTPTMPAQTLDLLEAEKPTVTNGFAAGIAHLARHPSFAERDLSSMRRGNLYPIMAPERAAGRPGVAAQHARA